MCQHARFNEHDVLGRTARVPFTTSDSTTGGVFSPVVAGGTSLRFTVTGSVFTDEQTASTWEAIGCAISGPLAELFLDALHSDSTFWLACIAAFPEAEVYTSRLTPRYTADSVVREYRGQAQKAPLDARSVYGEVYE